MRDPRQERAGKVWFACSLSTSCIHLLSFYRAGLGARSPPDTFGGAFDSAADKGTRYSACALRELAGGFVLPTAWSERLESVGRGASVPLFVDLLEPRTQGSVSVKLAVYVVWVDGVQDVPSLTANAYGRMGGAIAGTLKWRAAAAVLDELAQFPWASPHVDALRSLLSVAAATTDRSSTTLTPHARLARIVEGVAADAASPATEAVPDVEGAPSARRGRSPVRAPPMPLPTKKRGGAASSPDSLTTTDTAQIDDDDHPSDQRAQRINGAIGEGTAPTVSTVDAAAQDYPEDGASCSTVTVPQLDGAQLDRLATHRPRADRVLSRSPEPGPTPPIVSHNPKPSQGSAGSPRAQTRAEEPRTPPFPTTELPTAPLPDSGDPFSIRMQEEQSQRVTDAAELLDRLAVSGNETAEELFGLLSSASPTLASTKPEQHSLRIPLCARAQRSNLRVLRDRYASVGHFCIVMREVLMQLCRENGSSVDGVPTSWEVAIDGNALALCALPHSLQAEERSQLLLASSTTGFAECGRVTHFEDGRAVLHVEKSGLSLAEFPTSLTVTVCPEVDIYARALDAIRRFDEEGDCIDLRIRSKLLGLPVPQYEPPPTGRQHARLAGGTDPLNPSQLQAITAAQGAFTLVRGPPGTGKSSTSACIVRNWLKGTSGSPTTLVTAQQNKAVDRIALELQKHGIRVIRVLSHQAKCDPQLQAFTLDAVTATSHDDAMELSRLLQLRRTAGVLTGALRTRLLLLQRAARRATSDALDKAQVICCTCAAASDPRLADLRFRNVLVDEATTLAEWDLIGPLVRGSKRVVLVGDPAQLGPFVGNRGSIRDRAGAGISTFERLLRAGEPCHLLDVQYRMHPSISAYPNATFYQGSITDAPGLALARTPSSCPLWDVRHPVSFVGLSSDEQQVQFSFQNPVEVRAIVDAVRVITSSGYSEDQVVVITFYSAQVRALQQALDNTKVRVGSVDAFQGQESAVVLLSCVRSRQVTSFLKDRRRLCVAFTRAQNSLVVFGNYACLEANEWWRGWLTHVQDHGTFSDGALAAPAARSPPSTRSRTRAASPPPSPPALNDRRVLGCLPRALGACLVWHRPLHCALAFWRLLSEKSTGAEDSPSPPPSPTPAAGSTPGYVCDCLLPRPLSDFHDSVVLLQSSAYAQWIARVGQVPLLLPDHVECNFVYPFYAPRFHNGGVGPGPLTPNQLADLDPAVKLAWEAVADKVNRRLPGAARRRLAIVQTTLAQPGARRGAHLDTHGDFIATVTFAGSATVTLVGVDAFAQSADALQYYILHDDGVTAFEHSATASPLGRLSVTFRFVNDGPPPSLPPSPPPSPPPPAAPVDDAESRYQERVERFRRQYAEIWGVSEPPTAVELDVGHAGSVPPRVRGIRRTTQVDVYFLHWRGALIVHAHDPTRLSPFHLNTGSASHAFLPWFYGRAASSWLYLAAKNATLDSTFTTSVSISSPLAGYGRHEYVHNVYVLRYPDEQELSQPSTAGGDVDRLLPPSEFSPLPFDGADSTRFENGRLYRTSPDMLAAHFAVTRREALGCAVLEAFVSGQRATVRSVALTCGRAPELLVGLLKLTEDAPNALSARGRDARVHSECFELLHHQSDAGLSADPVQSERTEHLLVAACRVILMKHDGAPLRSAPLNLVSHAILQFCTSHVAIMSLHRALPTRVVARLAAFNDAVSGHHVLTPNDSYLLLTLAHDYYLQAYRGTKHVESRLWSAVHAQVVAKDYLCLCSTEPGWPPLWRTVAGVYQHADYPAAVHCHGESLWRGASLMDAEQIEVALYRLYRARFANIRSFRKFFHKPCWTTEMCPVICWAMAPIVGVVEHAMGRAIGEALAPGARGVEWSGGAVERKEGGGDPTENKRPTSPTGRSEWL